MSRITSATDDFANELEVQVAAVVSERPWDLQDRDQIREFSARISDRMWTALAGTQVYIPKNFSKRDLEIFARVEAGESRDELCTEYGITGRRLYQIVDRVRRRRGRGSGET